LINCWKLEPERSRKWERKNRENMGKHPRRRGIADDKKEEREKKSHFFPL